MTNPAADEELGGRGAGSSLADKDPGATVDDGGERPQAGTSTGPSPQHAANSTVRRTRFSAAWAAIVVAVLLGVALIDFIVENTRSERIDFFGVSGHIPVAVGLLAAALAGAFVVVAIGIGRMAQLRLMVRRQRSSHAAEGSDPAAHPSTL